MKLKIDIITYDINQILRENPILFLNQIQTKRIMKIDKDNVIVGGSADITAIEEDCIEVGMKELIAKPVTFKKFKAVCEQYL